MNLERTRLLELSATKLQIINAVVANLTDLTLEEQTQIERQINTLYNTSLKCVRMRTSQNSKSRDTAIDE